MSRSVHHLFTTLFCAFIGTLYIPNVVSISVTLPVISSEGLIPFNYQNATYHTAYKAFGIPLLSLRRPLVVLHGGPGLSYDYLIPFQDLSAQYGIPVILYDQIGNARSSRYPDAPSSFWSFDLFISELTNVIDYFKIGDDFDLAGHSWGSILGSEFALQKKPAGLKHFVHSNGLASEELWGESSLQLYKEFPPNVTEGMTGGLSNPALFEWALKTFYAVHGNRVVPPPKEYLATIDWLFGPNGDPTVAGSGVTNDWSIINRAYGIGTPTLVINGRYDIAQDWVIKPLLDEIPNVKWAKFENSSHMPFWEERSEYMQVVSDFLSG